MIKQKLTNAFIIDDNQEAIELLQRMLENNYSVQVVGNGARCRDGSQCHHQD